MRMYLIKIRKYHSVKLYGGLLASKSRFVTNGEYKYCTTDREYRHGVHCYQMCFIYLISNSPYSETQLY